jgi:hypothetical protein
LIKGADQDLNLKIKDHFAILFKQPYYHKDVGNQHPITVFVNDWQHLTLQQIPNNCCFLTKRETQRM